MQYIMLAFAFLLNGFIWLIMAQVLPALFFPYLILAMGQFIAAAIFALMGIKQVQEEEKK